MISELYVEGNINVADETVNDSNIRMINEYENNDNDNNIEHNGSKGECCTNSNSDKVSVIVIRFQELVIP